MKTRKIPADIRTPDYIQKRISVSPNGCWVWQKSCLKDGYGTANIGGTQYRAHRLSYTIYRGEIPDGLVLDHLCRNRPCVNPDHLEPVTIRVNTARGTGLNAAGARARANGFCIRGHNLSEVGEHKRRSRNVGVCRKCWQDRERSRRKVAQ